MRAKWIVNFIVAVFCLSLLAVGGLCQEEKPKPPQPIARVEPAEPRWGEKLVITYDTKAAGAKFSATDEVYVTGALFFAERTERVFARMERAGDLFKYEVPIKENMSYASFYFITPSDWDRKASASGIVYRADGFAAKGAYLQAMNPKNYKENFEKEMGLYPDNYRAYRNKWFFAGMADKANVAAIVKADMDALAAKVKEPPADLLYSLTLGNLLLKQEEKAREMIKKLAQVAPDSPLMGAAISDYHYQVFSQQLGDEGSKEIEKLRADLARKYPHTDFARNSLGMVARDKEFPLASTEAIFDMWVKEEPDNPGPYLDLALAYKTQGQKLDRAAELSARGINLLLQGKMRRYDDISGTFIDFILPGAYSTDAEIALRQRDYARAVASIKAAQALERQTGHEFQMIEGRVWQEAGMLARAENAFLQAHGLGSKEAEEALQAIYKKKNGSLEGFADYLAKKKEAAASSKGGRRAAPAFSLASLDGKPFDLAALRGKVVVVNFWFIGCAPCRVEIPGLNKLVAEYKDKGVVFVAPALDKDKELRDFLKEVPFAYQILPNASELTEKYGVSSYPTHLVIDRNGQISATLTGGSTKRHEDLRPLIERALAER